MGTGGGCSGQVCKWSRAAIALLVAVASLKGCARTLTDVTAELPATGPRPQRYDDTDWEATLRLCVRGDRVNYAALIGDGAPLERYLHVVAAGGPTSLPDQFPTPNHRAAFAINAFNACALHAALMLISTMPTAGEAPDSIDERQRFRIDGRAMTLADLRRTALEETEGDPRVLFCLCNGTLEAPPLLPQPVRPDTLDRTLEETSRRAMDNPRVVSVDHRERRLLVSQSILEHEERFLDAFHKRHGRRPRGLAEALAALASPMRGEWLLGARDYEVSAIPADRRLNSVSP